MSDPSTEDPSHTLAGNVAHFARALRRAGLRVGPADTVAAVEALLAGGIGDREAFYWTLHSVLVTRHEDTPVFEEAFRLFWRSPDLVTKMLKLMSPAVRAQDTDAYYYANEAFHETIRAIADQTVLMEETTRLQKRLRAYRRLQLRAANRMRTSFAEHDAIVARIAAGDAEGAEAVMRAHVIVQGERFGDLMASLEAAQ